MLLKTPIQSSVCEKSHADALPHYSNLYYLWRVTHTPPTTHQTSNNKKRKEKTGSRKQTASKPVTVYEVHRSMIEYAFQTKNITWVRVKCLIIGPATPTIMSSSNCFCLMVPAAAAAASTKTLMEWATAAALPRVDCWAVTVTSATISVAWRPAAWAASDYRMSTGTPLEWLTTHTGLSATKLPTPTPNGPGPATASGTRASKESLRCNKHRPLVVATVALVGASNKGKEAPATMLVAGRLPWTQWNMWGAWQLCNLCANIPPAVSLSFKQFEGSLNLQTLQHCYMGNPTLNRFKLRIRWAIWMLGGEIVTIAPNRWISEVPKLPEKKTWKNSPAWLVWCLSVGRPHNVHLAHSITQMLSYVLNCWTEADWVSFANYSMNSERPSTSRKNLAQSMPLPPLPHQNGRLIDMSLQVLQNMWKRPLTSVRKSCLHLLLP